MDKATFRSIVSDTLNRGSRYDSLIDGRVRQAIRLLEQNYTFKYMERYVSFTLDKAAANPEVMEYPPRLKKLHFIRLIVGTLESDEGAYRYLKQISPKEMDRLPSGIPSGYWIDGKDYIRLNAKPDKNYAGHMVYDQFSDYDSIGESASHWLLDNAEALMLAQTVILLGPATRNLELAAAFKQDMPELMKTVIEADADQRQADVDWSVEFGRDYDAEEEVTV